MRREVHIQSYFSLPTDLAGQMMSWPEYEDGSEYDVSLLNAESGERVQVRYVSADDETDYVSVCSENPGQLFDRVLGVVVYSLSQHSDTLMVHKWT